MTNLDSIFKSIFFSFFLNPGTSLAVQWLSLHAPIAEGTGQLRYCARQKIGTQQGYVKSRDSAAEHKLNTLSCERFWLTHKHRE